ncbi:hypothetical protein ACNA33_27135 [Klebsiella pneumoniae]
MTDITALAQSLKRRATSANEFGESLYVKADDVIALVEALEKAQQRISQLESRTVTVKLPPHAPENLAYCLDGYETWLIATTFRDTWNKCLEEVMRTGGAGIKWEAE